MKCIIMMLWNTCDGEYRQKPDFQVALGNREFLVLIFWLGSLFFSMRHNIFMYYIEYWSLCDLSQFMSQVNTSFILFARLKCLGDLIKLYITIINHFYVSLWLFLFTCSIYEENIESIGIMPKKLTMPVSNISTITWRLIANRIECRHILCRGRHLKMRSKRSGLTCCEIWNINGAFWSCRHSRPWRPRTWCYLASSAVLIAIWNHCIL